MLSFVTTQPIPGKTKLVKHYSIICNKRFYYLVKNPPKEQKLVVTFLPFGRDEKVTCSEVYS